MPSVKSCWIPPCSFLVIECPERSRPSLSHARRSGYGFILRASSKTPYGAPSANLQDAPCAAHFEIDLVFVPRFFIHCGGDFTLEQEGCEDLLIFPEIEEMIEQVSRLQRGADARLTVFDPHGSMVLDTLLPPLRRASVGG